MLMNYQVDLNEELAQVAHAVDYYQDWAGRFQQSASDELASYYRGMAAGSDSAMLRFRALFFAMRLQPVLTWIQQCEHPPYILDLGCGYGLETMLLCLAGARVCGIDTAVAKIEQARLQKATYEQQYGRSLDVHFEAANLFDYQPEESFDAVYTSATLHHIEPVGEATRVIASFIRPGGWFFLSDENGYSPLQQLVVQKRIGWTSSRYVVRTDPQTGQSYPYGRENIRAPFQWAKHMRHAALVPEYIKYCRLLPPLKWPLERLVRYERALRRVPIVSQLAAIGFLFAARKPLHQH